MVEGIEVKAADAGGVIFLPVGEAGGPVLCR